MTWKARNARFELRVSAEELSSWRALADRHGVPVADLVRHAMMFAAEHMPVGHIAAVEAARMEGVVRTFSEALRDVGNIVRTESESVSGGTP